MKENYIVINGKRLELTEEQLKQLGVEVRKNPFERNKNDEYFSIDGNDGISVYNDNCDFDDGRYEHVNYFNDGAFAKQVALHQLLYRKLLKFAYENGYEDTAPWDGESSYWHIEYDSEMCEFCTEQRFYCKTFGVYFSTEEGAKRAIKEVIKPFMKEHFDFVW